MASIHELLSMLQDPDPSVRMQAIHALGESGSPMAVDALRRILWDERYIATHAATLRALGRLGGERALDPLVRALDHEHDTLRTTAAQVLGELGDRRAVEPLIAVLGREEGAQAAAAAEALGRLGDPRAVEPLLAVLNDPRAELRAAAAQALGALGDARAVPPLLALLDDDASIFGGTVSLAAAHALLRLGVPQARAAVEVWMAGPRTLISPDPLDDLVETLRGGAWDDRCRAAAELGRLGDARAFEPLAAALYDPDAAVRRAAAGALGALDDVRAVAPLLDALSDPAVARAAVVALGRLGDTRAVPRLIALLNTPDDDLDYAAAAALERIGTREAQQAVKRWRHALDEGARFPPPPREV